ncbi:LIC_13387 family protein [Longispora urticae]
MKTRTLFRVGAWSWVVTGVGHTVLDTLMSLRPTPPADEAITAAMKAHTLEIGGIARSTSDLLNGFSIAMGLAIALVGVLFLVVARSVPQLVGVTWLGLGASLTMLALAAVLMPSPPIVLFSVASLGFGLSLVGRRRHAEAPGSLAPGAGRGAARVA